MHNAKQTKKSFYTRKNIKSFFQSNSTTRLRNANARGQWCTKFRIILLAHICLQKVFTGETKKVKISFQMRGDSAHLTASKKD